MPLLLSHIYLITGECSRRCWLKINEGAAPWDLGWSGWEGKGPWCKLGNPHSWFLTWNGICSGILSQFTALTGVTGPAVAGDDPNTPFGIPVWDCCDSSSRGIVWSSSWSPPSLGTILLLVCTGSTGREWLWPSGMGERADP